MAEPKWIPGKFVWFELVCRDPERAQAFYREVLGWTVRRAPMGGFEYAMIEAGGAGIGGYAAPQHAAHWQRLAEDPRQPGYWISYLSVADVDTAVRVAAERGGEVIEKPFESPGIGRMARIADPQGAELFLFRSAMGDPPDVEKAPHGHWIWNELHTREPERALAFYAAVVGFTHQRMDMGPGGEYIVLSSADRGRGGITGHLPNGARPHWLPYVAVDDVDATIARAQRLGAVIPMNPEDIPGVGRIALLEDPGRAPLALLEPAPMS